MSRPFLLTVLAFVLISTIHPLTATQRTVRATDGWTEVAAGEARAFAMIENGTMYDVYIVSAASEVADRVELMQASAGKTTRVKELSIAAFDRLEMSPTGTFLQLSGLKRPLKSGDSITIVLKTDGGEALTVSAPVK
jgi:copper(I)-binding protein